MINFLLSALPNPKLCHVIRLALQLQEPFCSNLLVGRMHSSNLGTLGITQVQHFARGFYTDIVRVGMVAYLQISLIA